MQTLSLHVLPDDAVIIRDALAAYRSPITDNMAQRDCLLEMITEQIDRASAAEILPADWLEQQHRAHAADIAAGVYGRRA